MIEAIQGLPALVTAFRATGTVTREDYYKNNKPIGKKCGNSFGKIHYMLVLNTSLSNYTAGALLEDAILGFKYFPKWKKVAIVTDKNSIKDFTDFFWEINSWPD